MKSVKYTIGGGDRPPVCLVLTAVVFCIVKDFLTLIAAVSFFLPVQSAQALEGFYFGAGIGHRADLAAPPSAVASRDSFLASNAEFFPTTTTADDFDGADKFLAGYQFKNFSVEIGYSDLGRVLADASAIFTDRLTTTTTRFSSSRTEYRSITASIIGSVAFPTQNIRTFARAGAVNVRSRSTGFTETTTFTTTSPQPSRQTQTFSVTDTSTSRVLGAGIEFRIEKTFSIRLELERYSDIRTNEAGSASDFELVTFSFLFTL